MGEKRMDRTIDIPKKLKKKLMETHNHNMNVKLRNKNMVDVANQAYEYGLQVGYQVAIGLITLEDFDND